MRGLALGLLAALSSCQAVPETPGPSPKEQALALEQLEANEGHATAITSGESHSCALVASGRLKCWGRGDSGQLGLGDTLTRGDEPGEMGDALPFVDLGTEQRVRAVPGR